MPLKKIETLNNTNIPYRVLTLDGGGAKGFHEIGALEELENLVGCPLYKKFDLISGVSTGAFIATGIAFGKSMNEIYQDYKKYIPQIMRQRNKKNKSQELGIALKEIFGDKKISDAKTGLSVIALDLTTKCMKSFKSNVIHSHGSHDIFEPGFNWSIVDILLASSAAVPYFDKKIITTPEGNHELIDGGFMCNNPTLYAIIDAKKALSHLKKDANLQVINIGAGEFPKSKPKSIKEFLLRRTPIIKGYIKDFEIGLQAHVTEHQYLCKFIYEDVNIIRINGIFTQQKMTTHLLENDPIKLSMLYEAGKKSFEMKKKEIKTLFPECCSYENIRRTT